MSEKAGASDFPDAARLAKELRILLGTFKRRMRDQTRAGDLTSAQISVLVRLESDGAATVSMLAREAGVRPQSMGATVAALAATGLICGVPDPADGRQTLLSLTDTSRDFITETRLAREDWLLRAIENRLTVAEQADLAGALRLLKRLVEYA